MGTPHQHSLSSVRRWKGCVEDYYKIHEMMDSTKGGVADNRHRVVFHSSFGSTVLIPRIFGPTITNSDGIVVSTKDIAEQHILEDFKHRFIPTLQDWIQNMPLEPWMNNSIGGALPPSAKALYNKEKKETCVPTRKELGVLD